MWPGKTLSHCKKISLQLRFLKTWLSKSHPCVISVFDASYKLTVEIDLEEFLVQNEINTSLGGKRAFKKV